MDIKNKDYQTLKILLADDNYYFIAKIIKLILKHNIEALEGLSSIYMYKWLFRDRIESVLKSSKYKKILKDAFLLAIKNGNLKEISYLVSYVSTSFGYTNELLKMIVEQGDYRTIDYFFKNCLGNIREEKYSHVFLSPSETKTILEEAIKRKDMLLFELVLTIPKIRDVLKKRPLMINDITQDPEILDFYHFEIEKY